MAEHLEADAAEQLCPCDERSGEHRIGNVETGGRAYPVEVGMHPAGRGGVGCRCDLSGRDAVGDQLQEDDRDPARGVDRVGGGGGSWGGGWGSPPHRLPNREQWQESRAVLLTTGIGGVMLTEREQCSRSAVPPRGASP